MRISIFVATLLTIVISTTTAQPSPAQQQHRIERLAELARVWGVVKYFHPAITQREIAWDEALTTAVMSVGPTTSKEDYRRIVQSMLARLDDPMTRVRHEEIAKPKAIAARDAYDMMPAASITRRDQITVIDGAAIADYWARSTYDSVLANRKYMTAALDSAEAVVFDLRFDLARTSAREPRHREYVLKQMLASRLPLFTHRQVSVGAVRARVHSGFAPQEGSTSGGYYSGTFVSSSGGISGLRSNRKPLRIAVIVDSTTPDITRELVAMRQIGGVVIVDGSTTFGASGSSVKLRIVDGIDLEIRTGDIVDANGQSAVVIDTVVAARSGEIDRAMSVALESVRRSAERGTAATQGNAAQFFAPIERGYDSTSYPARPLRLLALFRYWNVINYFYPYKHLIGEPWDSVLPRFIPEFEAARDSLEYAIAVAHLATAIHDMHGFVNSPVLDSHIGRAVPGVIIRPVEGRAIVVQTSDGVVAAGLRVGDEILRIDGSSVDARRATLSPLISASTPQSLDANVYNHLLSGAAGTNVEVTSQREGESPRMSVLTRDALVKFPERATPIFRMLPEGYGYADLDRLTLEQVSPMFDSLKGAPAIIFDMRGYPNGTAWPITQRLIDTTTVLALFRRPQLLGSEYGYGTESLTFEQTMSPSGDRYSGKVVVLINGDAGSQSEHTCLFLEAAADATFVGSPTMGGNGDVTHMLIPGGIRATFSGHDVRHADGRQLQRIGIEPHIRVEPTVAGIRAGRDEILEAAIRFLQSGTTRPAVVRSRGN